MGGIIVTIGISRIIDITNGMIFPMEGQAHGAVGICDGCSALLTRHLISRRIGLIGVMPLPRMSALLWSGRITSARLSAVQKAIG